MTVSTMMPHGSTRLAAIRIFSLAVRALVAVAFVSAGAANLSSTSSALEMYEAVGIGPWLLYLAAFVQVTGATMLLLPGAIGLGALLLAATMVCALLGHLLILGDSPVQALALLAATAVILWYRRREVLVLYRRHLNRHHPGSGAEFATWLALFAGVTICAVSIVLL